MEGRQGVPLACLSWSGTTPFQLEEGSWAQCSQPAMCEVDKACVPWEGLGKRKETASKLHSPGQLGAEWETLRSSPGNRSCVTRSGGRGALCSGRSCPGGSLHSTEPGTEMLPQPKYHRHGPSQQISIDFLE